MGVWNVQSFTGSEKNRPSKTQGIIDVITSLDFVAFIDTKHTSPELPGFGGIVKKDGGIMFVYNAKFEGYIEEIIYDDLDVLLVKVDKDFTTVDNSRPFGQDKDLYIFSIYWRPSMEKK